MVLVGAASLGPCLWGAIEAEGVLEWRLVLSKHRQHAVHLIEGLEERDEF